MQRKDDKLLLPLMIGTLVGAALVFFLVGFIWGLQWFLLPIGIVLGLLGAFIIFGRRVQKSVYKKAEGQAGAAAWALDNMQGAWRVTNAEIGRAHAELQSLMRISYAGFCLKKKKTT